jgi:hypothetical protein
MQAQLLLVRHSDIQNTMFYKYMLYELLLFKMPSLDERTSFDIISPSIAHMEYKLITAHF